MIEETSEKSERRSCFESRIGASMKQALYIGNDFNV